MKCKLYKWDKIQEKYLLSLKNSGKSFAEITSLLNEKFKTERSIAGVQSHFNCEMSDEYIEK